MKVTKQTVRVVAPEGEATPTQQAVRMGAEEHTFTCAEGREYHLRALTTMEFLQFSRAMGADNTANTMWMNFAVAAAVVRAVDGQRYTLPTNPVMAEKRVGAMSPDALNQIVVWIQALAEKSNSAEETVDAAKN